MVSWTQLIASLKLQQQRLVRLHTEEGENTSPDAFRAERARMQDEIAAAEASLAETQDRLEINETDLCRALELAEDIAAVYELADERTRRGYNQAFFTRIKITARWDETESRTVVEVAGVELTEPYAVLLADDTEREALAWVEAIKARKGPEISRKSPRRAEQTTTGAFSRTEISIYEVLAERAGFEPAMEFNPHTRLAGECLQPLGHLSLGSGRGQFRACRSLPRERVAFSGPWKGGRAVECSGLEFDRPEIRGFPTVSAFWLS